jgi:hypothetical protein
MTLSSVQPINTTGNENVLVGVFYTDREITIFPIGFGKPTKKWKN